MDLLREAKEFFNSERSEKQPTETVLNAPLYEHPPSKAFGHHFTLPLPQAVRRIDEVSLRATLANVNYSLVGRLTPDVDTLSLLVTKLRGQIVQKPLLCDTRSFYVYGALVKKLSQWFYNTNAGFVCYFDAGEQEPVGALLYEYIQVLLLTAVRLYADINAVDEWTLRAGPPLAQVRLVLEELVACVKFAQREPFQDSGHTNHWFFKASPQAMGNATPQPAQSQLQQDKAALWRHIEGKLGGVPHLEALLTLTEANLSEVRAQVWLAKMDEAYADGEQYENEALLYDCFAPQARRVAEHYKRIADQLAPCRDSRLLWYAKFQALYWTLRCDLALAEYEADYFRGATDHEDFVEYGRSGLKRAEQLIRTVQSKGNKTATAIKMDQALKTDYDGMVARLSAVYNELYDALPGAYGYNADLVSLKPVGRYEEPPRKTGESYQQTAAGHLQYYMEQNDRAGVLQRAFAQLEELYSGDRSLNALVLPSVRPDDEEELVVEGEENAEKRGRLQERRLCYEWLLSHRDKYGRVTLSEAVMQAAQAEVPVIEGLLANHSQTAQ